MPKHPYPLHRVSTGDERPVLMMAAHPHCGGKRTREACRLALSGLPTNQKKGITNMDTNKTFMEILNGNFQTSQLIDSLTDTWKLSAKGDEAECDYYQPVKRRGKTEFELLIEA